MKNKIFHCYCSRLGKFVIKEVPTANIEDIAEENPFAAFSLGTVEAENIVLAEGLFKRRLAERFKNALGE